jgi:uncharacterized membrane protein YfcA
MGLIIGVIAGMCGIGGGIISTPILISMGVPTSVAIITAGNQVIASSFSSYLIHSHKRMVDYKLASLVLLGSTIGSIVGVLTFYWLSYLGKIEVFVSVSFVLVLSLIGTMSAKDAALILYYRYKKLIIPRKNIPTFVKKFRFLSTNLVSIKYPISALLPVMAGFVGGLTLALLGIGGSLIIMPILLYVLGIPQSYATGSVNFQMIFATTLTCLMHSLASNNGDIVLATTLIIGTVFGAQIGAKIGSNFSHETFKIVLATVLLILCIKVGVDLFATPKNLYSIERVAHV